jgi:hypothetical protein
MIAGLRLDLLQARPGLQREGKKLRAVIVTVFRLVASAGKKTKSAAAPSATADQCKEIVVLLSLRLISRVRQPFLQSQRALERAAGYRGPACDS